MCAPVKPIIRLQCTLPFWIIVTSSQQSRCLVTTHLQQQGLFSSVLFFFFKCIYSIKNWEHSCDWKQRGEAKPCWEAPLNQMRSCVNTHIFWFCLICQLCTVLESWHGLHSSFTPPPTSRDAATRPMERGADLLQWKQCYLAVGTHCWQMHQRSENPPDSATAED